MSLINAAIFAWHCVLSDRPPMLWWLSHGEGRDAVTYAVGINCKNGATTEKSRLGCRVSGLRGVSWWLCVCFFWLDMTTPPWCREKVMVYYIIIKNIHWGGSNRSSGLLSCLLLSIIKPLFLPSSSVYLFCLILAVPMRECLGNILVWFLDSYSHSECYYFFSLVQEKLNVPRRHYCRLCSWSGRSNHLIKLLVHFFG